MAQLQEKIKNEDLYHNLRYKSGGAPIKIDDVVWSYLAHHLSIIPADHKTKKPLMAALPKDEDGEPTWKPYQERQASSVEVERWLKRKIQSIAVVCGAISKNLEILDFDDNADVTPRPYSADEFFNPWWTACGDLVEEYDLPVWRTGGGGYAIAYRCETIAPNNKLTWVPDESADAGRAIAIETRGEGGYALPPPSLHPSGNRYTMIRGDLTKIATIPVEMRAKFFEVARSLCLAPYAKKDLTAAIRKHTKKRAADGLDSVITTFNAQNNIVDLLERHNYTHAHGNRWKRPDGKSGSVDVFSEENISFHWSSNDALHFTNGSGPVPVDPFQVYAVFEHGGDHEAAFIAAKKALGLWVEKAAAPEMPSWMADAPQPQEDRPVDPSTGEIMTKEQPVETKQPQRRVEWSAADLYDAEFPPPKFAVNGLIPEGLTMLIARPKIGKSWLGLQFGIAVGTGGHALGEMIEQGKTLYLALEDSPLRMQDRMFHKQRAPRETQITVMNEWPSLSDDRAINALIKKIETDGYTLVIIDTLQRAVGGASVTKDAPRLSKILGALQQFALRQHVAILVIHHSRKSATDIAVGGGDVIDDAMGGTEIAGVVDAMLGIYRKRGDANATLRVTGRDIGERDLAIKFDKQFCCWQIVGDADAVREGTLQAAILETIDQLGKVATLTQIAKFLERDKGNIKKEISELVNKNILVAMEKQGREVRYKRPDASQPTPKSARRDLDE
jgi:hypothetical protein